MCKFCGNSFIGEEDVVSLNEIGGVELVVEGNFLYAFAPDGNKTVVEIKFCPMCGEKL